LIKPAIENTTRNQIMIDLTGLKQANAARWEKAKLTHNCTAVAKALVTAKCRYRTIENRTGVPWFFIAVAHERESSQRWDTQLGQGDPLNRISAHIPKGRGPFNTWEDGAYDALVNCGPFAARNKDWSAGGTLTLLEQYNGLGYAARGRPSPYIWSGTDQYISGKYIRDGVYDPEAIDSQLGCAGLLMAMMALDPTITFAGAATGPTKSVRTPESVSKPTVSLPAPSASVTHPAKGSISAFIAAVLSAIFRRR
jgi:lysozyme family protein